MENATSFAPTASGPRPPRPLNLRPAWPGLVLFAWTFLVFLRVLRNGFYFMDDQEYVLANPMVRSGLSLKGAAWAFTAFDQSNWHPLTWLSHMADCSLWGLNPAGHHLTSLLLHSSSAALAYFVLVGSTGAVWESCLAAGLFALHPLRVESVAWVAERKDQLFMFFWLAGMLAYLRWLERPTRGRYAALLAAYACGLLSKGMGVTFPFALLVWDAWPLGRAREGGKRLALEKAPLLVLAAGACWVTARAQHGFIMSLDAVPFLLRAGNAVLSYARYLGMTLWPLRLGPYYAHPFYSLSWKAVLAAFLPLAALSAAAFRQRGRRPWLLAGWCWYLGTLVPVIGLVQLGYGALADRYTYLPHLGLAAAAAWTLPGRWRRVAGPAALLLCSAATFRQLGYWSDTATLFRHGLEVEPRFGGALVGLGRQEAAAGRFDQARDLLLRAARFEPDNPLPLLELGRLEGGRGRWRRAAAFFDQAAYRHPGVFEARAELASDYGNALAMSGRFDEAERQFRSAVGSDPSSAEAHSNLGIVLARRGLDARAAAEFELALRLRPDLAAARDNLRALKLPGRADAYRVAPRGRP